VDNQTEQLADGVWRVEVLTYVNAYVLANDGMGDAEGLTVVDTGTKAGGPRLVRSVRMLGFDPRAIGDVLLTHRHADHAGSAARFASSSAGTRIWCGQGDLGAVRGEQRLPRSGPPAPTALGLVDGDRRDAAGGLEVIDTPGHTPGHLAFLLPARGVLLAGDALMNIGFLSRGPTFLSSALSARSSTLRRIASLPWDTLAVGHGPSVRADARSRVERLASR
jgi:glyoxylase-like metal-dependent hydrolase (beta-lactamase superfamily II)